MNRLKPIAAALGLTAALLTGAVFAADKEVTAEIDKPAPDFELTDVDGKAHKLSDYEGKWVVLEWINFDCPFVRRHYGAGNMQALQKKYGKKDVVWLTICSSAPGKQGYYDTADIKERMKDVKMASTAYLVDETGKVGRKYQARTTPHMFVIDPEGKLIYAGAIDDKRSAKAEELAEIKKATNYVQACLEAAMAGKEVAVKTSTPYGCSVKYGDAKAKPGKSEASRKGDQRNEG